MAEGSPILKLFLIGFHHKKGWLEEIQYPPSSQNDLKIDDDLPTLCLPDQSHNFSNDTIYFVLPSSTDIFGVSCFRQVLTENLCNKTENEFTRSSVQKAVCCLSRLPLFGYIEVKLNIIIDKIFEQENFNCEELLKESYNELNRCLFLRTEKGPVDEEIFISNNDDLLNDFYIGICLRELILTWRHKILILFKLLLLEKRILFYGSPVSPVSKLIQSILSLHPQLLNKGLCNNFEPKKTLLKDENKDDVEKEAEELVEKNDTDESDAVKPQQITMQTIPPSEWFAPMHIFKNGYLCLPFLSLPYIDTLSDKRHNGFVVGASNVLFQQKRHLVDILIDVPSQQIDLIDVELKKCLQLTTEDLRFFEHILKGIESPKVDDEQIIGSDHWIRKQFESYFTSMLRTAYDAENQRDVESFNEAFIDVWKKTNNYQDWLAKKITFSSSAFDNFPVGHPFYRANNTINVSDVKNKIVQSINNTPSARKTVTAVSNTISNAKSSFSTWFSNLSVKEESQKNSISMEERVHAEE